MQFIIFGEAFRDRKFDKFPFQCFTTLTAKELFLITKLQTASHSLNAFFLLMSLVEEIRKEVANMAPMARRAIIPASNRAVQFWTKASGISLPCGWTTPGLRDLKGPFYGPDVLYSEEAQ